jgi:hypothetical protein
MKSTKLFDTFGYPVEKFDRLRKDKSFVWQRLHRYMEFAVNYMIPKMQLGIAINFDELSLKG